jgi:hypothetical protein
MLPRYWRTLQRRSPRRSARAGPLTCLPRPRAPRDRGFDVRRGNRSNRTDGNGLHPCMRRQAARYQSADRHASLALAQPGQSRALGQSPRSEARDRARPAGDLPLPDAAHSHFPCRFGDCRQAAPPLPARQGAIQPVARLDACPIARSADTTADDLWTPTPTADG